MKTIREIARQAGVSPATVSRAFNGSADVNAETKVRVLAVAKAANYHPQASARNLRSSKARSRELTYCIGFINFRPHGFDQDLFSFEIVMAVEGALRERGFGMRFVCASPAGGLPQAVGSGEVDGVIALGKSPLVERIAAHLPTVSMDAYNLHMDALFSLVPDYRSGAHAATARLLDAGYRRLAVLIDPPSSPESLAYRAQVAAGCRLAYEERGQPVPTHLFAGSGSVYADGYRLGCALFATAKTRPDALIGSDGAMLGVYRAAAEHGLRIPDDLGIIGIDGLGQDDYLSPPLTSVDVGIVELARLAAGTVIDSVVKGVKRRGLEVTPVRLIERASVRTK